MEEGKKKIAIEKYMSQNVRKKLRRKKAS